MPNRWLFLVLILLHPLGPLLPFYLSAGYRLAWRRSLSKPWRFVALGGAALLALYVGLAILWPDTYLPVTVGLDLLLGPTSAPVTIVGHLAPEVAAAPFRPPPPLWWDECKVSFAVILVSYPMLSVIRRVMVIGM